ncbi:MAG: hypothetical protein JNM84_27785, partial [Planctomycetes bacterium]|nr:hypothetical protein [Planctomycetota bacterium]
MAAALWLAVGFLVARARRGARSWDDARTQLAGAGAGLLLAAAGLASWIQPFAGLGGAAGCGPFGGTTTAATAGALLLPIAFRAALVAARARDRALALASAVALAVWVFSLGVRASWIAVVGSALFVLAGSIGA